VDRRGRVEGEERGIGGKPKEKKHIKRFRIAAGGFGGGGVLTKIKGLKGGVGGKKEGGRVTWEMIESKAQAKSLL